jgi:hypothetical protein
MDRNIPTDEFREKHHRFPVFSPFPSLTMKIVLLEHCGQWRPLSQTPAENGEEFSLP